MSSKENGPKNGHGNQSAEQQQPGPSTADEQQTKGTTARSPALNFNARTPSSSTELSASADQQQYQRWPGDRSGPSPAPPASSASGAIPPPVLVSPHYSLPPHIQQQYQQHHLGAPGGGGGGFFYTHQQMTPPVAPGQHSPGQQRHYAPPPPQMLHPGMMYHHHQQQQQAQQQQQQHMASPYHQQQQQYGAVQHQQHQQAMAAAAAAYWARTNGQQQQQQQMPTPPAQDVGGGAVPGASTSARHTPQPSSVPPPNPSPVVSAGQPQQPVVQSSPSATAASSSAPGTAYDECGMADGGTTDSAQRPRSRQQQQQQQQAVHLQQQPPQHHPNAPPQQAMMLTPQAAAAHLRYASAVPPSPGMMMMVGPPGGGPPLSHGPPPQQQQQHAYAPPMGPPPHPSPHMAIPPMHHHHYATAQGMPPPFPGLSSGSFPPQFIGHPPPHPGMYFHPGAPLGSAGAVHHPSASAAIGHPGPPPPPSGGGGIVMGMKQAQREAVEKLVMQLANTKQQLTAELVHERRLFFEKLVLLNEQQGEVLSGPPQVSKSTVDLFSLYFAVKKKGGFEKTIKDKVWKHMCVEANADMQESSAAGFQLRKHYQKYLLKLECMETGQNAKELVEFAEKQKKKKKEKEPSSGGGGSASAAGPSTPSSAKDEQQQQHGGTGRPSSARGEHSRDGTNTATVAQQRGGGTGTASSTAAATTATTQQNAAGGAPPQQQQQQQFSGAPGTAQGIAGSGGAEFGQFAAATPPFGQYQPPQWAAAFQQQQPPQGMYPSPRMAPPPQQQQQMMRQAAMAQQHFGANNGQGDDEQQQQQRPPQVSSRLSTPAPPQTADQRPISRASTGGDQSQQQRTIDQHQQQDERGEAGAVQQQQQQQQQRRAQTPSAATFSANAPTPPLTTSSASGIQPPLPPPSSTGAGVPFYHPGVPYGVGRYPPTVANEAAAMYGPAGPSAAMYSPSQQQLAAVAHQQRYQQQQQAAAAAAAASARYYPSMPGVSASVPPQHQQQAQKGAVASSTAKPLPQQHFVPPPPSFYAAGNRSSNAAAALLGVVPPPPMLPPSVGGSAVVGPPPPAAYAAQQQQPPYAMPSSSSASAVQTTAWHYAQQQQHQFPANSLEAQVIAQVQQQTKRSREKVYARDLYGATPARIVMALRSALHTETVWALNALNVQLYDDTTLPTHAAPSLTQTPELLNLLVDHLAAALSLLFPDNFNATSFFLGPQKRPPITKNDNDNTNDKLKKQKRNTPPTTTTSSVVSSTKTNVAIVNGSTNIGNGGALLAVPKQEQPPPPPPYMLLDKVEVLVPNMSSALFTTAATTAASPRHAVAVPSSNGGRQSNRHHHNGGTGIADNNNKVNFTRVSRLGRPVKWDTGELPPALAREVQLTIEEEDDDERREEKAEEMPPFLHFVERVRQSVLDNVCARGNATNRQTTKAFGRAQKTMKDNGKENDEFWEPSEEGTMEAEEKQKKTEDGAKPDNENAVDAAPRRVRLFFHRADDDDDDHSGGGSGGCSHCLNRWHTDNRNSVRSCRCTGTDHHFSLLSRPVGLQDAHADERMAALVEQCLALANILRGYAFLPGHERTLATHGGLLRLLSALMMLMVDKKQHKRAKPTTKRTAEKSGMDNDEMGTDTAAPGEHHPQGIKLNTNCNNTTKPTTLEEGVKQETEDENQQTVVEEGEKNLPKVAEKTAKTEETTTLEEDDVNSKPTATATTTPAVAVVGPAPEADTRQKWLLKVANQLRDDAFVIMAQLSAHLDLFDLDSAISWPIFDALLHWSVSSDLQARDPLPPFGVISPRHYAFEILCKMSVLERNVDLLVSTGPWPRLEAFVRLLCAQICEEPPVREFAIVILNAVCAVSEPACFVAAVETPLLEHLVSFLEAADANMTQIVQQQGMHALRENPEIIGTSVGMLRRATTIMVQIAKHEQCRRHFRRLQHRLLQFTVSHFMDLRVAAMVANILFEIQRGDSVPLLPPPPSSAEANRGGNDGMRSANTAASTSPPRRTESPADAAETGRKSAEAKTTTAATGKECRATPTPFLLGDSVNSHVALFNGTTTTTMCSSAAEGIDNICSTFTASSACATSSQCANTVNVYVPPKVNKRENNGKEEEEDSANECYDHADGNNGGDNRSNKTDINRGRKRMFNNNNNISNYNENDYQKWNGHHPANAQHFPIETVVDQMPTERRLRMDEGEEVASPSSVSAGGNAVVMNNGRSSVKVRERMRHNILSKKASLKAASAAAASSDKEAAVPTALPHRPPNKRNNGWIGDDDGDSGGADPKKKKKLLHNGTAEASGGANKNGAEMATAAQNPSSASPAGTSGGGGGGSSLTAVA